jgi:hypothetical protein
MREYSVVRFRHSDRDYAAPRFLPPNLSRRVPAFPSKFDRLAAAGKSRGLTAEQTRLWANIARFVLVVCAYAGLAVGVHLGAAGGF